MTALGEIAGLPRAAADTVPRAYIWLAAKLERPHIVGYIAALAFVFSLPAIACGMTVDDYLIEPQVLRDPRSAFVWKSLDPEIRRADLLDDRAAGRVPWWIDENYQQAFLRPLASLTHAIDFRFWPRAVWLMHVENALWFALVVWLGGGIYRQLRFTGATLGFATFFYATRGSVASTVGWLSARNTILGTAFGLAVLAIHLRAHERTDRSGRFWLQLRAAAALAGGLACSEFAVCTAGFLLAHALVVAEGPLVRRLVSLWPYGLVLAVWQVVHISGGYGVAGSDFYHGPAQAPGPFVLGVLTGVPIYLATQLTIPVATLACFYPWSLPLFTIASLLVLYGLRNLLLPAIHSDPRVRFLALGAALSLIPLGSSVAQDRLVFFVGFGAAGVLAILFEQRFERSRALPLKSVRRLFRLHAFYTPIFFVPWLFSTATANAVGGGTDALTHVLPDAGDRGVILINAPSELLGSYQQAIRARRGQPPLYSFDLLYAGAQAVEVWRVDARTLELHVPGGYLAGSFERIVRSPRQAPFHPGDTLQLSRLRVVVMDVNHSGAPTRVRFEFPRPLEHLPVDWLIWRGTKPVHWAPPSIGARVDLGSLSAI